MDNTRGEAKGPRTPSIARSRWGGYAMISGVALAAVVGVKAVSDYKTCADSLSSQILALKTGKTVPTAVDAPFCWVYRATIWRPNWGHDNRDLK